MFKLKYNFLALSQVVISLFNYFLLMRIFGVSDHTDAYLIVSAILGALILLQMLSTEQFLFFYNDIKIKGIDDAYNFYNAALTVSILTGIITLVISYFGSTFIVNFFISKSDNSSLFLVETFFRIAMLELLVAPVQSINQKLLNAEMRFSLPYILNIIPTLFVLMAMVYLYYLKKEDISILIYARAFGAFVSAVISLVAVKSINIPVKLRLKHPQLKHFMQNSFTMRVGHNIHNFLFTPITTNILTALPSGYASYFYYAMKVGTIVNGVVIGPSLKVFQSKFSNIWSQGHTENAKDMMCKYFKITVPLILLGSVIGYLILPNALASITDKLSNESLSIIQNLFMGLMIWQFIILIESGSVLILVVEKKSQIFIYTNLIFSAMYFGLANLFLERFSVFSLIYALIVAQWVNFVIYVYYGKKILKQRLRTNEA